MIDFRLARFALVGLANTAVGLAIIFGCKALLGMADAPANLTGYTIALLLGFTLNRRWTFGHAGNPQAAFARYLLVLGCAYLANLATVMAAIDWLHLDSYLAQAAGIVPYTVTSYLGSRLFAFPATKRDAHIDRSRQEAQTARSG
ncbi:GtrA family protein [Ramlibacter sp.]|uniref:GtrA family protein n=1 Tax=Ramlibacter sp. TaxID=1917967 RepID=UPI002D670620|nr:GtrA family protein [Ramlibacter sp.]HYD77918.1 GtrA family protein [Ramlibacter sp.]